MNVESFMPFFSWRRMEPRRDTCRSEKMFNSQLLAIAAAISFVGALSAAADSAVADEVRYYDEGGVTYRETRRVVRRPICESQLRPSTQTVYREQRSCELRDTLRTSWTPVTEYRCEAHWVGRWNPFAEPYLAYRMVPQTRWEHRSEVVQVPVTSRRLVPETRTVQVPVVTRRMVTEEVITRVALGGRGTSAAPLLSPTPTPSPLERIGGVARLDKDPPRQGASTAWRRSTTIR